MSDNGLEKMISRTASHVRAAKHHLQRGDKREALRFTRKAQASLTVIRHAQLIAAVDRMEGRPA